MSRDAPPPLPWLVTGASGFLGRHLLLTLEAGPEPGRILALVRDRNAWETLGWTRPLHRVEPLVGDVTDTNWWRNPGLDGLQGIYHLAALVSHRRRDAGAVHHINVNGTLNLVRLAAERRCRMLFVSTSGTVGCFRRPGQTADESAPYRDDEVRHWPYYRSKVEAEREARRLAEELGVELVIVRPPVLLGPQDHRLRSSAHVLRLLQGKVPFLIRGGMHFADVRDVAPALVRAMRRAAVRPVYNLPGTQCSIQEFYTMVADLAGTPPPRLVLPYRAAWLVAAFADWLGLSRFPEPGLVEMAAHYWGLTSKYAEPELTYRCRPGRETLADTVAWLRENSR